MSLSSEATDPNQYERQAKEWLESGSDDSSDRRFIREYLLPELGNLKRQSVLDVGCGTGWLSKYLFAKGAGNVTGVDPALTNIKEALRLYPKLQTFHGVFQEFNASEGKYNLVVWVLSTEHIEDLRGVLQKTARLTVANGRLIIVAADKESFLTPRWNYKLEVEELAEGEYAVKTKRPGSVDTVDIIRSVEVFERTASQVSFNLILNIPMKPTVEYLADKPRMKEFKNKAIFQLMVFEKANNR